MSLDSMQKTIDLLTKQMEDDMAAHQALVDSFDDYEQSALWKCLNAKKEPWVQDTVNSIAASSSKVLSGPFYRGIARKEVELIENAIMFGCDFEFGRATSFTTVEKIAKQFSANAEYGTNMVLVCDELYAFDYLNAIQSILTVAPSVEFMKEAKYDWQRAESYLEAKRYENIEMILDEQEYIVHKDLRFFVQDYSFDGYSKFIQLCLA